MLTYIELDSVALLAMFSCHNFLVYSKTNSSPIRIQSAAIPGTPKDSQTSQPNVCVMFGPHPPFEQNCSLAMCFTWLVRSLIVSITNEPL